MMVLIYFRRLPTDRLAAIAVKNEAKSMIDKALAQYLPLIANEAPALNKQMKEQGVEAMAVKSALQHFGSSLKQHEQLSFFTVYRPPTTACSILSPTSIFRTTSIPFITLPKMVYLPSKCGVGEWVIKNWLPSVSFPADAMPT
jgi:hypothetical protein